MEFGRRGKLLGKYNSGYRDKYQIPTHINKYNENYLLIKSNLILSYLSLKIDMKVENSMTKDKSENE
jgi:hypothetical protein